MSSENTQSPHEEEALGKAYDSRLARRLARYLKPYRGRVALAIALLMVSRVPTFSGKMIGQKIPREHVPPLFVLAALFIGSLLTYPSLTLAVGSVIYLALIPLSAYRYFQEERKTAAAAKAQNGKGTEEQAPTETPSFPT